MFLTTRPQHSTIGMYLIQVFRQLLSLLSQVSEQIAGVAVVVQLDSDALPPVPGGDDVSHLLGCGSLLVGRSGRWPCGGCRWIER